MSLPTCPICDSVERATGYGVAAGPIGFYSFCEGCDNLLEFSLDYEGLGTSLVEKLQEFQKQRRLEMDLFLFLRHGDITHRKWLFAAIHAFFHKETKPELNLCSRLE